MKSNGNFMPKNLFQIMAFKISDIQNKKSANLDSKDNEYVTGINKIKNIIYAGIVFINFAATDQ